LNNSIHRGNCIARPTVNHIQLTDADVKRLKGNMKKKDTNQTTVNRCHVLLAMDENHPPVMTYVQCVETYGISRATIATLVKNYANGGIDAALARSRSVNSDQARRTLKKTNLDLTKTITGASQK